MACAVYQGGASHVSEASARARCLQSLKEANVAERATSYDFDGLMKCARGELFGPGNAQLPAPPMLMMDRITSVEEEGGEHGKGKIVAEFDVKPDNWFFECHFLGDPVMPGCLGLDAPWQMTGFFLGW